MSTPVSRAELGSWRAKLFYGFGSVAYGIKDFGFGTLLLFYYNRVVGLPPAEVSFAIALVLVFDAFADPIVGQFSDGLRTRWGRRHPLMYFSAVPVAVSYYFLWVPPHWSHGALFVYLVVMAILVRTFITMYEIPSAALVPEMTDDYDQRTSFVSVRYLFGVLAGVGINVVTYRFLLFSDALHKDGQLNPAGYPYFALVSSIVMVVSILVSARGTHRYIPLFRVPEERRITLPQMFREMGTSLWHPQFLTLVGAAIFGTVAISIGAALVIYFNTYFWQLSTKQIGLFGFVGLLAAFLAPVLAGPLSRPLGKKNAALLFYFFCVVLTAAPISLRLIGFFPPNGSTALLVLLFLERSLSVLMGIACLILFSSMMADVVDDSALKTGRRSEGLFFAFIGFIGKLLSGAGTLIAGQVLQFAGMSGQATPTPDAIHHLAIYYLPCMVFFYGIGILLLSRYRISRELHNENIRLLNETEAEAAVAIVAAPPVT
ncbi:MAG TPA: MFS transporter [Rhizomicrobium sp.]|jgi:GPH family glycoside/pentoside/hexuronide:cation symporter|nr:MFS transporter [Rhizomicrobium sp.]